VTAGDPVPLIDICLRKPPRPPIDPGGESSTRAELKSSHLGVSFFGGEFATEKPAYSRERRDSPWDGGSFPNRSPGLYIGSPPTLFLKKQSFQIDNAIHQKNIDIPPNGDWIGGRHCCSSSSMRRTQFGRCNVTMGCQGVLGSEDGFKLVRYRMWARQSLQRIPLL